jgi:hypothetical protein
MRWNLLLAVVFLCTGLVARAASSTCTTTVHYSVLPLPNGWWTLICAGSCDGGSGPCSPTPGTGGNYQFCGGCPGEGESGCCHAVMSGYTDSVGNVVGTGVRKVGNCEGQCPQSGVCTIVWQPWGEPPHSEGDYTATCLPPR